MSGGALQGRVALVTGAAQGQGLAHVLRFLKEGANVIALDVSRPSAEDDVSLSDVSRRYGSEVLFRRCDVRDGAALSAVVSEGAEAFGQLDLVVANAGVMPTRRSLLEMREDEWQQALDVNLTGVWNTCRAAVPHIIRGNRGGSIVVISSTLGIKASGTALHYTASKHGVVGLMKSLALHLGQHSIRVNSIHPTTVDTPMLHALAPPGATREQFAQTLAATHALPVPWIEAEDVSNAILFLASSAARYITGVTLPVDAGALLK